MTSYYRKYVTALASAKSYIAQWSCNRFFVGEELIEPFPTLAIYDEDEKIWSVNIKAWVYLPFHPQALSNCLPTLPNFVTGKSGKTGTIQAEESTDTNNKYNVITSLIDDIGVNATNSKSEPSSNIGDDKGKMKLAALVNKEINLGRRADGTIEDESDNDDDSDNMYAEALQEEFGEVEENPSRLGLFFIGNSVKVATKSIINGVEHLHQPSDESGFIEENVEFSNEDIEKLCVPTHEGGEDKKFSWHIQLHGTNRKQTKDCANNSCKKFECVIYVPARNGISIISDIDDTIKKSHVLNKRALLKHTFYSYFKPIEGMSELYQKWHEQKCQFHYVSASPWQLYPALRCFMDKHKFPPGTVDLRRFSWSLEFLHTAFMFKLESIVKIVGYNHTRQFICIGDSGERDPDVYALIYQQYPDAIAHILIRDLCKLRCPSSCRERYEKVFEKVPKDRWTIFKDPEELPQNIHRLIPGFL